MTVFAILDSIKEKSIVEVDRYGVYDPAYRAAGEHHRQHEENRPFMQ
ncbi:MAG: hypothetical protein M1609_09920 [Firmicutes bacterium]|nr:hypothetical protein [Bacillota bacterium]